MRVTNILRSADQRSRLHARVRIQPVQRFISMGISGGMEIRRISKHRAKMNPSLSATNS